MLFLFSKVMVTALVVVAVGEIAQRSDKWGGLIAALPLTTFLIISWMYFEGASATKIGNHMRFTLFFVLPTLPMFLVFPYLIDRFGFPLALVAALVLTSMLMFGFNALYEHFGFRIF